MIDSNSVIEIFVFGVKNVNAASFSLIGNKEKVAVGESIQVDLFVDSGNVSINTLGGSVVFDPTLLQVEKIINGNSIITFWVESPKENNTTGIIDFSGIIPGGIVNAKGYVFSILFSAKQTGQTPVTVSSPIVLQNDGTGNSLPVSSKEFQMNISGDKDVSVQDYKTTDTISPEKFTIIRTRDNALFDNKWFVVYSTQDKGSGISHYDVCEFLFRKCKTINSPYELENQSNWYRIYVKAYDNNNNVQYAFLFSKNVKITLASVLLLGILITVYVYFFKKKRKTF
jgi:hypothetical protein